MKNSFYFLLVAAFGLLSCTSCRSKETLPNIIIIYADDLGYGDVSCYGATRVSTPNIDRLAVRGLLFTNAHCTSSTCTPSRYSMLTGEYAWRRSGTSILTGDAPAIINSGRTTIASLLKEAGYKTGVVGKWHLGLGPSSGAEWNAEISCGPMDIGFDYNFIIPATGDRVPCVFVENRKVVNLDPADPITVSFSEPLYSEPMGRDHPELLKMHPSHGHDMTIINGISRIGYMSGGNSARWIDENIADVITGKAVKFIENNRAKPFFLYFSTHDIHVPRVPAKRFAGKSGLGPRGDVILEFDWSVGRIIHTIDSLNLSDNTIIIVTSDNGPVVDDGYKDQAVERLNGHNPAGPLRGGKYSLFEGGTRVVFIVSWKDKIVPGVSGALLSQIDLMSSFATLTGQTLSPEDGPDSFNQLDAILGKTGRGRDWVVEQSGRLSIIKDDWKYIEAGPGPAIQLNTDTETGNYPLPQLYNLNSDLGEKHNVAKYNPDLAKELSQFLKKIRDDGRTRF